MSRQCPFGMRAVCWLFVAALCGEPWWCPGMEMQCMCMEFVLHVLLDPAVHAPSGWLGAGVCGRAWARAFLCAESAWWRTGRADQPAASHALFFAAPILLQDLVVTSAVNTFIYGFLVGIIVIWRIDMLLAAVPIVGILVILYFAAMSSMSDTKLRRADAIRRQDPLSGQRASEEDDRAEMRGVVARLKAMNEVGYHSHEQVRVVRNGEAVVLKDKKEVMKEKKEAKLARQIE